MENRTMTKRSWGKIKTISILYFFILVPFFFPHYIIQIDELYSFRLYWTYLSLALMFFYVFRNYYSINRICILYLLLYAILIYSTIQNGGNTRSAVIELLKVILLCLTVGVTLQYRENFFSFLIVVRNISIILFLIDFALMILYPNGVPGWTVRQQFPVFLYGNVNTTIKAIFPGLLSSVIIDINKNKLSFSTLTFLSGLVYLFIFIYTSATSIVAIAFIVFWFLMYRFIGTRLRSSYLCVVLGVLFLEVTIVILSSTGIVGFITGVFNKSADLSGRAVLWLNIESAISKQPIFGYGIQSSDILLSTIGNTSGSHNYYLDMVYRFGLSGFAVFILIVLYPLSKIKNGGSIPKSAYMCLGFICSLFIMFISEPFYGWETYIFPIIYGFEVWLVTNRESGIV